MYYCLLAIVRFYYKVFFGAKYYGTENIPMTGGVLICSNHPSNNDPVIVATGIRRRLGFMAKKELFNIPVLNWFIKACGAFPIDRSISDLGAVRTALSILKSGTPMMMFPEGRRNSKIAPELVKPGAAAIAQKAGVSLLPVYIDGKYKLFGKVSVYYGKPVPYETIDEVLKEAAGSENKNAVISHFLYDCIISAKEGEQLG